MPLRDHTKISEIYKNKIIDMGGWSKILVEISLSIKTQN